MPSKASKYNFCTLFNIAYASRGIAMYESLKKNMDDFTLYIYPFDDETYELLVYLKLPNIVIVPLGEFENERLLEAKKDRTIGEYCWTCTPSIIKYSIEKFGLDSCVYIDSDLYFFSNPSVLVDEMGDKSILLTEHRYTPKHNQVKTSGIYCVQFMGFKNDEYGLKALNWWVDACIEWCYARCENGKFGDQKYLDDWTDRFEGVHLLRHLGGGVAPWNVQQYEVSDADDCDVQMTEKESGKKFQLIFYHFHGLKLLSSDVAIATYKEYDILPDIVRHIYRPYIDGLLKATEKIKTCKNNFVAFDVIKNIIKK